MSTFDTWYDSIDSVWCTVKRKTVSEIVLLVFMMPTFEYQGEEIQPSRKLHHPLQCEVTSYSWPTFPFPLQRSHQTWERNRSQKLSRCQEDVTYSVLFFLMLPHPLLPVSGGHLYPIGVIKQTRRRWCVWVFCHTKVWAINMFMLIPTTARAGLLSHC